MPCSSPHHAPLQVRGQRLGPNVLLGTGLRLANARVRKWPCSRINSYFDPSVRSDCGSLMSICLAATSLAPGNPTGFLRIGEGFQGFPIRHKHTHTRAHTCSLCQRGEHVVVLAAGVSVCCVQGYPGPCGLRGVTSEGPKQACRQTTAGRERAACRIGSVSRPEGQTPHKLLALQQNEREREGWLLSLKDLRCSAKGDVLWLWLRRCDVMPQVVAGGRVTIDLSPDEQLSARV